MLKNLLQNYKTVSGASVMLIVWLLQQAGIQSTVEEVGGFVGAILTIVGLTHKIIKGNAAAK
jgi:hypothetical protein